MWPFRRKSATKPAFTIAHVVHPNGQGSIDVVTVLSPQQQMDLGCLPGEAIAGTIAPGSGLDGRSLAEEFTANPVFVDFMHRVIDTFGREHPELQEAARQQGMGSVGVIDLRTPEGPQGRVPIQDVVGIFAIDEGRLGAYHPNDKHVLLSRHGLVRLPPELHDLHVRELMRLRAR